MRRLTISLIQGVVALALSLSVGFAQEAHEKSRTIWDGVYTDAQAKRGYITYHENCSRCHGEEMARFAGALEGDKFMEGWGEDSVHSLFKRIQTTMPPGRAGSIPDQAYTDIVAYIFSRNEFPTGDSEMAPDALEDIRIQSKDGPRPVPSFSLVEVVGCLVQDSEDSYRVTNASAAVRIRDPEASTGEVLEAAKVKALGDKTFTLLRNVVYLEPEKAIGLKVEAKGFLIRDPSGDRINVSTLQAVGGACAE